MLVLLEFLRREGKEFIDHGLASVLIFPIHLLEVDEPGAYTLWYRTGGCFRGSFVSQVSDVVVVHSHDHVDVELVITAGEV